jgi:hypothetical protein
MKKTYEKFIEIKSKTNKNTYDSKDFYGWPWFITKQTFTKTVEECKEIWSTYGY